MSSVIPLWEENRFLTSALYGRVLDLGCGNGDYTAMLWSMVGVTDVLAADILPPSSGFQGKGFSTNARGFPFVRCDAESLPFADGSFDCLFCWRMMQYARDGAKALAEIARVTSGIVMLRMPIDPEGKSKDSVFGDELARGRADAFTWRTFWDEDDLQRAAWEAGLLSISGSYIDRSNSQVRLFAKGRSEK